MNLNQEADRRVVENERRLERYKYSQENAVKRIATSLAVDDVALSMEDAKRDNDRQKFFELEDVKDILEKRLQKLDYERIKERGWLRGEKS